MKPLPILSIIAITFGIFLVPQQSSAYYFDVSRTLHPSSIDENFYPLHGNKFSSYSDIRNRGSVVRYNQFDFPSINTGYRGRYYNTNNSSYSIGSSERNASYPASASKTHKNQYWYEYRFDGKM